jgi:phage terminase large subunit-like protein
MKTTVSIPTKNGYTDGEYIYRPQIAEDAVTWFKDVLRFPEEPHAGEAFVLTDWQADYVRALYGWRSRANEERRRYTRAWLEVARGNGKTALHSGLGIKGLQGDGRRTPSVVSAATDRNTAGIIFKYAARMVLFDKGLTEKLRVLDSTKRILRKTGTGVYFVISADANRAHGYHPTLVLLDEVHTQPSRELYDVLGAARACAGGGGRSGHRPQSLGGDLRRR